MDEQKQEEQVQEPLTLVIQLSGLGDINFAVNYNVPLPHVIGLIELAKQKMVLNYYAQVLEETKRDEILHPKIVVPNR